jgi:hypothetical protein
VIAADPALARDPSRLTPAELLEAGIAARAY